MDESLEKVFDRANKASGVVIAKAKSIGGLPLLSLQNFTTPVLSQS